MFSFAGRRWRADDAGAIALLTAMPLALFWRMLSGQLVVAGYDLVLYTYPYRVAAARAMQNGRLPMWNPDVFAGVPFLANIQAAVFYPFNLLFAWPGGPQLLTWSVTSHLALAGVFFFLFCRKALGTSAASAAIGGLTFGLSGFAVAQAEHLNQIDALPWVPAIILGLDRAYRTRRPLWVALLAVFIALQLLAGHPQEVYYTVLLALVWLTVILARDRETVWRSRLLSLGFVGGGVILGAIVAAAQLIPTAELARYSIRSEGLSYEAAAAFSLPFHYILGNLMPDFRTRLFTEHAGYVGLLAVILALYAIVRLRRDPRVVALVLLALFSVLMATAGLTPVFRVAYHLLPGVALFRSPSRIILLFTFSVAALAAFGADDLEKSLPTRGGGARRLIVLIAVMIYGGFVLAGAAQHLNKSWLPLKLFPGPVDAHQLLIWGLLLLGAAAAGVLARRRPGLIITIVCGLVAIELFLAAQPMSPLDPLPAAAYTSDSTLAKLLPHDQSPFRSLSLSGLSERSLLGSLSDPTSRHFQARRAIDQPDLAMQDGRATLDGYDGGILPLSSYVRFRSLLVPAGAANVPDYPLIVISGQPVNRNLLALLNVKYLLEGSSDFLTSAAAVGYTPVAQLQGVTILENPAVLPRAFLVHQILTETGSTGDLAQLGSADFDPGRLAIVSSSCPTAPVTAGADQVRLLRNDPEEVDILATSSSPGALVFSMAEYPGWKVTVDGQPQSIRRVDAFVQGVCLGAGTHRVEWRFQPTGWPWAVGLSTAGLLLVAVLVLLDRLRRAARVARA